MRVNGTLYRVVNCTEFFYILNAIVVFKFIEFIEKTINKRYD